MFTKKLPTLNRSPEAEARPWKYRKVSFAWVCLKMRKGKATEFHKDPNSVEPVQISL